MPSMTGFWWHTHHVQMTSHTPLCARCFVRAISAHAAHLSSNCSRPLRSCCLFKRVHLLLYAVIAFTLSFALPVTVYTSRWTSRRGQLPNRKWVTDIQCPLAGSSLLLLPDRSQIDQIRNNKVHQSDEWLILIININGFTFNTNDIRVLFQIIGGFCSYQMCTIIFKNLKVFVESCKYISICIFSNRFDLN